MSSPPTHSSALDDGSTAAAAISEHLKLGGPKLYIGHSLEAGEGEKSFNIFSNIHHSPIEDIFGSEDGHDHHAITTPTTSTTTSSSSATSFMTDPSRASSSCSTPDAALLPAGHANTPGSSGDTAHIGIGGGLASGEQSDMGNINEDNQPQFNFHGNGGHMGGGMSGLGNSPSQQQLARAPPTSEQHHNSSAQSSDPFSFMNSTVTEDSPFAWSSSPLMGAAFTLSSATTSTRSDAITTSSNMPISMPMPPPPPRRTTSEYTVQQLKQHQTQLFDQCFSTSSSAPNGGGSGVAVTTDPSPSFDELISMGLDGGIAVPLYNNFNPHSSIEHQPHQGSSSTLSIPDATSSSGSTILLPSALPLISPSSRRASSPKSSGGPLANTARRGISPSSETSSMMTTTPPNTGSSFDPSRTRGSSVSTTNSETIVGRNKSPSVASMSDAPSTKPTSSSPAPATVQKRGHKLPKHVTDFFRAWIYRNVKNPYPSDEEKEEFARRTGLKANQVANWFINARRRLLAPSRQGKGTAITSAPYDLSEAAARNSRGNSAAAIASHHQQQKQASPSSAPLAQQRPRAPARARSDYVTNGSRTGVDAIELQLQRPSHDSLPVTTPSQRSASGNKYGHQAEVDPFTRLGKPSPAFLAISNNGIGSMRSIRGVERSNSSSGHGGSPHNAMSISPTAASFSDEGAMYGMRRDSVGGLGQTCPTPNRSSAVSPAPFWALQNASVLGSGSGPRSNNAGQQTPTTPFDFGGQQQSPWNAGVGSYQHQWDQLQSIHHPNLLGAPIQQHIQQPNQNHQRYQTDSGEIFRQQQQQQYGFNTQEPQQWGGDMSSAYGQTQPPSSSSSNRDFL
ncbi:hypothetical protein FRB98_004395 [Tulasnella sp. 332]|nr:hypothetical protein FRB98_004395 [Tulasnella sp. 332]